MNGSLQDVLDAAVAVDDERLERESERFHRTHAAAAVRWVSAELGLTGVCVSAPWREPEQGAGTWTVEDWGHDSLVLVEDDTVSLLIHVSNTNHYLSTGRYSDVERRYTVVKVDGVRVRPDGGNRSYPLLENGHKVWRYFRCSNRVRSLADVGRLVAAFREFLALEAAESIA